MKLSISDFERTLRSYRGFRRIAAAFAFGLIGALAYAPTNMFFVLWISFPALIFLLRGTNSFWQAFVTGWSFAFGTFLLGLYWISAAMFVDIKSFWWAVPLAAAGLPAFFAIYYGLAAAAAQRVGLKGIQGVLSFALLWFLADYVRGHLFAGFPWNLEGYAWSDILPMLQLTSITGIYGLTLVTVVAASLAAVLAEKRKHLRVIVVTGSLVLLGIIGSWGAWRLSQPVAMTEDRIRILQPDIDQADKWIAMEREEHFRSLLALSSTPGEKPVTAVVWPETASTFYLAEDAFHRREAATVLPKNATLLTGVIRRELGDGGKIRYYNSLVAVVPNAQISAFYDKFHLVPFGEYIPVRKVLPIRTLAALGVDFTAGDRPHTMRVAGLPPFSPLICYEAIFPGEVADPKDRPQLLLNITNDGWYARTAGPYQHFATARVRAVEEGLPLVRAANTGISGIIDPAGRVLTKLKLGQKGLIDGDIPAPFPRTIFSRVGEKPLWIIFASLFCIWAFLRRKDI